MKVVAALRAVWGPRHKCLEALSEKKQKKTTTTTTTPATIRSPQTLMN